jgi:hypothetical protein
MSTLSLKEWSTLWCYPVSVTPTTRCHITEHWNLQQPRCQKIKLLCCLVWIFTLSPHSQPHTHIIPSLTAPHSHYLLTHSPTLTLSPHSQPHTHIIPSLTAHTHTIPSLTAHTHIIPSLTAPHSHYPLTHSPHSHYPLTHSPTYSLTYVYPFLTR